MAQTKFIKVAFFDIGQTLVNGKKWIPGAKKLLKELRGRDIRLGLITDTGTLKRKEVLNLLPQDFDLKLFDPELILMSSEVGFDKSDSRIFKLAIKKAGVKPRFCLFCTEDEEHLMRAESLDMRGAKVRLPPDTDVDKLLQKLIANGLVPG